MTVSKHDTPQIDKFKQAACELGCDEDEAAFDEKIKAIVKKPVSPSKRPAKPPERG